jgi:CRP-like cAMP-binding protein
MLQKDEVQIDLLNGLSEEQFAELRILLECCRYPAGEIIIHQNQLADNLYIVVSGEVEISHQPYDGPTLSVGRVSSGGVFGWSAILGRKNYSSTVTVVNDCCLYRIPGVKLQQFCEHHHATGVVLLERMALSVAQQPAQIHDQIMKILQSAMDCRDENISEVDG